MTHGQEKSKTRFGEGIPKGLVEGHSLRRRPMASDIPTKFKTKISKKEEIKKKERVGVKLTHDLQREGRPTAQRMDQVQDLHE